LVSKDESLFGSKILIYGEKIEDLKRYLQKKYLNDEQKLRIKLSP